MDNATSSGLPAGHPLDGQPTLVRMAWPIFVELLLQMLVGNIDQIMLSRFNATAVAAVGNANQIMTILILTFNVVSLASTILISQYLGAGDRQKTEQLYSLSILLNLGLGLFLAVAVFILAAPILTLMNVPAEVQREALDYLRITAVSLPCQALMLTFSAFLRAHAKMMAIMLSTGLINLLNIAGNTAFIYGFGPLPRLGAAGAALSTTVCRTLGMCLLFWAFRRAVPFVRLGPSVLRPFPKALCRRLIGIGLPAGGESLSYNMSQSISLAFVNTIGTYAVTTRMYTVMFAQVCSMLISAASQAGQIRIGYCIGAGDTQGAIRENRSLLRTFLPITVGITFVLWCFSDALYGLFSSDPRVISLGHTVLFIEIFLEIGRSLNIVFVRTLQACGDIRFPVLVGISSQWIIAVGICYLFGIVLGWGLAGMWLAFAIDELTRGALFILRWRSGKWKAMKTV